MVFGPTLLDVASHLSVGVGSLAIMFAVRAVGGVLGTVGSGFIFDRLGRFSYTMMICILLAAIISESLSYWLSTPILLVPVVYVHSYCM